MTREEAITMLANMRDGLHETGKDFPYRDKCIPYMKEACDMAIEALKQDSILDKIRAEIEALPKTYPFVNHIDMYVKVSDVTKIIEKYKAGE
jgi:hypothetical protein